MVQPVLVLSSKNVFPQPVVVLWSTHEQYILLLAGTIRAIYRRQKRIAVTLWGFWTISRRFRGETGFTPSELERRDHYKGLSSHPSLVARTGMDRWKVPRTDHDWAGKSTSIQFYRL